MPKYGYRQNQIMLVFTIQGVEGLIIVTIQGCQCICGVDSFVKAPVRAAQLTFEMKCGYVCGSGHQKIYFSLQNTGRTNEQCGGYMQWGNNVGLLSFSFKACSHTSKRRLLASYCLSVCPHMYQPGSYWTDFHEIWYWGTFMKICRENPNLFKSRQEYWAHYMRI